MTLDEARGDDVVIGVARDIGHADFTGLVDPNLPVAWKRGRPETWEPIDGPDGRTLRTLADVEAAITAAGGAS